MSSVSLGAEADGFVILDLALGSLTTCSLTRVYTLELITGLVRWAVIMGCALRIASALWIALVVLWAGASGTALDNITQGSFTASTNTWVDTSVVGASHS